MLRQSVRRKHLFLAIVLSGCAAVRGPTSHASLQPAVSFSEAVLSDASLGSVVLDLRYRLKNPNADALTIARIDSSLWVEGHPVASEGPPAGQQIPPVGEVEITIRSKIRFGELAGVTEGFLSKDQAKYRLRGSIGVRTPAGLTHLAISRDGDFEVPKIPTVLLETSKVTALSIEGVTLQIPVRVTAHNSYPLPIRNVSGVLAIAEVNVGTLSIDGVGTLEKDSPRRFTLPLSFGFGQAGRAIAAIDSGKADVSLVGTIESGEAQIPFGFSQLLQFVR